MENNGTTDSIEGSSKDFLIVGLGASAGGIKALNDFFHNVDRHSGDAYVVILHLSPEYESNLDQILRQATAIPVVRVTDKVRVEPDHVYVISPDHHLWMDDGHIASSRSVTPEERHAPIDIFFRTLAECHGAKSVGVILSGTGANGSMGLKRIKERGGAVLVQNPREADYNEMPRNAIETELVDEILPVARIPGLIASYRKGMSVSKVDHQPEPAEVQQLALREIFTQMKVKTGHDFSNYKRPTLLRRIERRINVKNLPDISSYAQHLQQHPEETIALLKDLLISVTNFFRDKKPFESIELDVIPNILRGKTSEDRVRIWIAGCATGEEAYTLAILFAERTSGLIDAPKIQIFATDIDESALNIARDGFYTINDAADVSDERLRRFFNKEGDGYRIRREIREMILFADHNFIKDPPFSRLDMISCRNVLIYLNRAAQERVMATFHFALNPGCYLFLGSSESVEGASDLYATLSRENHIFQSRQVTSRSYPIPESVPNFRIDRLESTPKEETQERFNDRITFADLHQRLLEQYAPPSVIINEEHEVVHMSENVGKYFEFAGGEPTQNILKLIHQDLRIELRSALYQATQLQAPVEARDVKFYAVPGAELSSVNIQVRPVVREGDTAKGFILVIFEPHISDQVQKPVVVASEESIALRLEEELVRLKMQLRRSMEQHEFQSEELKASNEELQAMNEELRSGAEELETSKEELQSINEELRTVNQELKVKIDETSVSTNNLQNLINSAEVGTIFLDRNLQIKLFTPAVRQIFNLISSDFGRPITDITSKMTHDGLARDAALVLEKLTIIDREITTTDDRNYMMRMVPFRTTEDRIDGVVITFFDVTNRRESQQALQQSENRFRTLIDSVPQVIWTHDATGKPTFFNQRWFEYSGKSPQDSLKAGWRSIIHPDDAENAARKWETAIASGAAFDMEFRLKNDAGKYHWHIGRDVPLQDADGNIIGWYGSATNIEKLKRAEEKLRVAVERLQMALVAGDLGSFEYDFKRDLITSTDQQKINLGFLPGESLSMDSVIQMILPEDLPMLETEVAAVKKEARNYSVEFRIRSRNGLRWIRAVGRMIFSPDGQPQKTIGITLDITEQKRFTEELFKQVRERTLELERSNEDLIQFAHVASHDLKEPVRKIRTYNRRLLDEFGPLLPEKATSYIDKITDSTSRMFSMIEGVLNYSMQGLIQDSFVPVDISKIFQQIEKDLELVILEKKATMSYRNVPTLDANPVLIYQLFYNLVNNSLKFGRKDVPVAIEISFSPVEVEGKKFVELIYEDNGIGFSNKFNTKIFDTFVRLNSKDEYEGTGLGLALCKKIVERHHGSIQAIGKPNKGATFIIQLPVTNH